MHANGSSSVQASTFFGQTILFNCITFGSINRHVPFFQEVVPNTIDETQGEGAPTNDEDHTMTSTPIPERVTRNKAQTLGVEHPLVSLFAIDIE